MKPRQCLGLCCFNEFEKNILKFGFFKIELLYLSMSKKEQMKEAIEQARQKSKKENAFYHVIESKGVYYVERGALPELAENETLIAIYKNGVKCI